jgi:hypothetical protein
MYKNCGAGEKFRLPQGQKWYNGFGQNCSLSNIRNSQQESFFLFLSSLLNISDLDPFLTFSVLWSHSFPNLNRKKLSCWLFLIFDNEQFWGENA